jgi:hypothetical protein
MLENYTKESTIFQIFPPTQSKQQLFINFQYKKSNGKKIESSKGYSSFMGLTTRAEIFRPRRGQGQGAPFRPKNSFGLISRQKFLIKFKFPFLFAFGNISDPHWINPDPDPT